MTTVRAVILITIGLFMAACTTNGDAERYARLVEEWQGRTIEFPSVMVDVATGDTIDMSDADFTLLTYIDSAGCTPCRLRLPIWTKFMESLDSVAGDYEVVSLIVVNAKDNQELRTLIRRADYNYPVILDEADSLNALNRFPEELPFRSLLLDRNHRIIAIGNPVLNNAVADMYYSLISGSKTFSRSGRQSVTATPSRIALGEIPLGQERSAEFSLKNQSSDTVYIRDIINSCHCTTATVADTIIAPGATLLVKVKIREDSVIDEFHRTVHIYYRDFDNPTVLHISGTTIY